MEYLDPIAEKIFKVPYSILNHLDSVFVDKVKLEEL